ncbi:Uncharacterised protein [Mycobacteroides abscessus subsp. massiliense]|nr:Uncharacterised protein [Mycobacteroides abscessus subsp. abscessus]SIK48623.1 Uncharacterised protein [Mycobacteroides abscessus subsp. abscessus]SKM45808.1 Uncharacterised protein [Mycobacteroides abscessus subsp. massiliense]SKS15353.1 Uncharacterised protein [Mycobacteroides abscessus subsp. abscessus]SKU56910.1 Uncharacterised protein [Mycobacteroides abscessus subsp. abscessus]
MSAAAVIGRRRGSCALTQPLPGRMSAPPQVLDPFRQAPESVGPTCCRPVNAPAGLGVQHVTGAGLWAQVQAAQQLGV